MKRNPLILAIGLLLLLIVALLLFVFQVRQSEVVVVTTLGKTTRTVSDPGPHLKWPWPIQLAHHLDQRVQNFEDQLTEGMTVDNFNLLSSVYVGWKITNAAAFFPKFGASSDPVGAAENVLQGRLSSAKLSVFGNHTLADFLSTTSDGNKFADVEKEILALVQREVRDYGLEIKFLGLKKLSLPENVSTAVFERMQAERKRLAARSENEGEAEAQKIRAEADSRAAQVRARAEGQAIDIRGKGEAEAAKSLKVFQQHPELAEFIFRLNALENSLKERSVLIFDQHTPPYDLFWGVSTNLLRLDR